MAIVRCLQLIKALLSFTIANALFTSGVVSHYEYGKDARPSSVACPCENPEWCRPLQHAAEKEVFIFVLSQVNWKYYDWSRITTVVQFGNTINDSLTCFAHSQGAKSVHAVDFPVAELTNRVARSRWVSSQVQLVLDHFLDGINVDFESEIRKNETERRKGLTDLMKELKEELGKRLREPQVTIDVAWSPDCIDHRCYDYRQLATVVDFMFVMSYDERGQIFGDCIANANSALNTTIHGIERFIALGIDEKKLVLGIPWYGYDYPCLTLDKENICKIKKVPFRGVQCSDAAGTQINYSRIIKEMLPQASSAVFWDDVAKSPYFNWKNTKTGQMHQIWFDDPRSLTFKYKYAVTRKLRGVGMWNADCLDYSNTSEDVKEWHEMWGAIPYVKKNSIASVHLI